jgi:hypothetical protein
MIGSSGLSTATLRSYEGDGASVRVARYSTVERLRLRSLNAKKKHAASVEVAEVCSVFGNGGQGESAALSLEDTTTRVIA